MKEWYFRLHWFTDPNCLQWIPLSDEYTDLEEVEECIKELNEYAEILPGNHLLGRTLIRYENRLEQLRKRKRNGGYGNEI